MLELMHNAPRIAPMMDMQVVRDTVNSDTFATDRTASASAWRWLAAELWLRMLEIKTGANP